MLNRMFQVISAGVVITMAAMASAHHSNTPFDMSRRLEATGVVTKANFKNPHSLLTLDLIAGGEGIVTYEGHSLTTLRHYGLKPSVVEEGETVTIGYAPRIDGDPGGIFLVITGASGETLDFSNFGYE